MTKKKEIKPKKPTQAEERLHRMDVQLDAIRRELYDVNSWCYQKLNEIRDQLDGVRAKTNPGYFGCGFLAGGLAFGLSLLLVWACL